MQYVQYGVLGDLFSVRNKKKERKAKEKLASSRGPKPKQDGGIKTRVRTHNSAGWGWSVDLPN